MQKGLELPLNAIIVIAIAVLVLVALFTFFGSQFFSGSGQVDIQKVFGAGCTALRFSYACEHSKVNEVTIDGTSLGYACSQKGFVDTVQCAKACGCSVPDSESGQALATAPQRSSGPSTSQSGSNQQTPSEQTAQNTETTLELVSVDLFEGASA